MKEILKPALKLFVIAVVAAVLLGGTYILTKEPIEKQEYTAKTAARKAVLSEAAAFELMSVEIPEEYEVISAVYFGIDPAGKTVGYTIDMKAKGYKPDINLTMGITKEGVITGLNVGSNEESPGLGANATKPEFYGQFAGKSDLLTVTKGNPGENEIAAISGATVTSEGITDAVNQAMAYFEEYLAE